MDNSANNYASSAVNNVSDLNIELLPMRREPLCYLTEAERGRMARNCSLTTIARGDVLFNQGGKADKIYLVLKGGVKTMVEGIGGRPAIVSLQAPMDFVGHRAVLAGEKHTASAVAITDVQALVIPRAEVLSVMRENPDMAAHALKSMARELRVSRQRGVTLAQKQIRGRLAESLLLLRDKFGYTGNSRRMSIQVTREELASLSNMTTANAIRTLSAFADEGLVAVSGREITIADEQGLEKTSQMG